MFLGRIVSWEKRGTGAVRGLFHILARVNNEADEGVFTYLTVLCEINVPGDSVTSSLSTSGAVVALLDGRHGLIAAGAASKIGHDVKSALGKGGLLLWLMWDVS
jgi:hypothetical protein